MTKSFLSCDAALALLGGAAATTIAPNTVLRRVTAPENDGRPCFLVEVHGNPILRVTRSGLSPGVSVSDRQETIVHNIRRYPTKLTAERLNRYCVPGVSIRKSGAAIIASDPERRVNLSSKVAVLRVEIPWEGDPLGRITEERDE